MKLKIILIILGIVFIIGITIFGSSIREKALKGMVQDIPEYNCGKDDICTSCIIDGNTCSCGTDTCTCGDEIVDKNQCQLYS